MTMSTVGQSSSPTELEMLRQSAVFKVMEVVMYPALRELTISGNAVMPIENVEVPNILAAAVPLPVRLPIIRFTVAELLLATFFLTHHPVTTMVLPNLNEDGFVAGRPGQDKKFWVRVTLV